MNDIGNSTGGTDWAVFPHQTQDGAAGNRALARSESRACVSSQKRISWPACAACCRATQVNENGMPLSTQSMDEWEDKVLAELGADARTYWWRSSPEPGVRDLFFTAAEDTEIAGSRSATSMATSL